MTLIALGVLLLATGAAPAAAGAETAERAEELVPFVLPWDDSGPGPTDVSGWLPAPAGRLGRVRVSEDGHLHTGDSRIRLLGVNVCFGACFPKKEAAAAISARMAKFGINCVRFHHMDSGAFPNGIRARNAPNTRSLDDEALDRLDGFIAQLKQHPAGMGWKSAKKDTVGRDWGKAPSLVEVVPATITLPAPAAKVTAWALDERGQHAAQIPVEAHDGQSLVRIGPPAATLWYEVTIR